LENLEREGLLGNGLSRANPYPPVNSIEERGSEWMGRLMNLTLMTASNPSSAQRRKAFEVFLAGNQRRHVLEMLNKATAKFKGYPTVLAEML
jgi:hypothetical protein